MEDHPGTNTGSYPNPPVPRGLCARVPGTSPLKVSTLPSACASATMQTALAERSSPGGSILSSPSLPMLCMSHFVSAPGNPSHASTMSPESSTRTGSPGLPRTSRAARALSAATSAGSMACISGRSRSARSSSKPRISCTSRRLFSLVVTKMAFIARESTRTILYDTVASMPLVDLDRFDFLYANRVKGMKSAATRDLMATLSRPGIISLAGGFPDTRAFGEEAFREVSHNVAADSAQALQYGPTAGLEPIKDVIVEVMAAEGTPARQEDVFVTTGAQQGLDLIAKVFLDEGDAILCEGPAYAGALNAFAAYRPRIAHVPMDRAGIIPVAARETLNKARRQGLHVKFIYTVPNFQNPAGVTMVAERRKEMLEMAREFDLVIVEDNPYGMLRFEGEPLPSLAALEQESGDGGPDRVVYLGTFSKIFAPGVRLGWVHAQPGILHKINVGKQGADLCSSNLSQMMISSYFQNADWRAYVGRLTSMYKERRDAMLDSLAEFMPKEVYWTHPEGGLFVWATLPSYLDATAMLPRAIARNVAYVPGEGFYAGGAGKNHMRLNFSFVEPEQIRRGIELLSEVVRERMELRSDLERGSQRGARRSPRSASFASGTDG